MKTSPETSLPAGMVLGGLHGSSGKTVLTCLLLAGLEARGFAVQGFKAGPDYLDQGFHNSFSRRPSVTLDPWLMGRDEVVAEAARRTGNATGILEGVMGLFDGSSPSSDAGSTMELSRWLGWPVVLCVPAAKAGRSLAAALRGFLSEAHPERIAGVVLNGVSGDSHTDYLREALRPLEIPVLGAIPRESMLEWPERYLGLQAAQEYSLPSCADLAAFAERTLDLDGFQSLAQAHTAESSVAEKAGPAPSRRLAIAKDEAFHFYYANNIDWLRAEGCELIPFSPLHSRSLPTDLDAILLGGGFPELFGSVLADNSGLRRELKHAVDSGVPCYAECGGLMLLADALVDVDGRRFPMAGCVPGEVVMTRGLQHFGYCTATERSGVAHNGHEFHHSAWRGEAEHSNAWRVTRRRTGAARGEGFRTGGLHASYVHLYFPNSADLMRAQLGILS